MDCLFLSVDMFFLCVCFIHVASIQCAITSGTTAVIQILESLLSSGKSSGTLDIQDLVTKGCDPLTLLGHAQQELSHRRRETMRPVLKKEYAGLVSHSVPVTSKLLGDDLLKTMKDL